MEKPISNATSMQPRANREMTMQPRVVNEKPVQSMAIIEKPVQPAVIMEKPVQPRVTNEKPVQPAVIVEKPVQPRVTNEKSVQPEVSSSETSGEYNIDSDEFDDEDDDDDDNEDDEEDEDYNSEDENDDDDEDDDYMNEGRPEDVNVVDMQNANEFVQGADGEKRVSKKVVHFDPSLHWNDKVGEVVDLYTNTREVRKDLTSKRNVRDWEEFLSCLRQHDISSENSLFALLSITEWSRKRFSDPVRVVCSNFGFYGMLPPKDGDPDTNEMINDVVRAVWGHKKMSGRCQNTNELCSVCRLVRHCNRVLTIENTEYPMGRRCRQVVAAIVKFLRKLRDRVEQNVPVDFEFMLSAEKTFENIQNKHKAKSAAYEKK